MLEPYLYNLCPQTVGTTSLIPWYNIAIVISIVLFIMSIVIDQTTNNKYDLKIKYFIIYGILIVILYIFHVSWRTVYC